LQREDSFFYEQTPAASYGRISLGAIVPASEYDFGSCERSIGGVSALKKARLDLVGEYVILVSAM